MITERKMAQRRVQITDAEWKNTVSATALADAHIELTNARADLQSATSQLQSVSSRLQVPPNCSFPVFKLHQIICGYLDPDKLFCIILYVL